MITTPGHVLCSEFLETEPLVTKRDLRNYPCKVLRLGLGLMFLRHFHEFPPRFPKEIKLSADWTHN